jgi:S-formylglutathione hydrolase FrmB
MGLRWTSLAIALCLVNSPVARSHAEPPPAPLGALIEHAAFESPALGRPITGAVYLSPGAGATPAPVVYLLHGTNSAGMDWVREAGLDAELRVIGGDHDWGNWSQALPDALIFVYRAFPGGRNPP